MIIKEILEINGEEYIYHYSDENFYIEHDGEKFADAVDKIDNDKDYTETTELIDSGYQTVNILKYRKKK